MTMTPREYRLITERFKTEAEISAAVQRLESHEPLAYVLGEWYFYDERYMVTPDCLIPRSDTELLVELLIKRLPPEAHFLDLCTGSGCIAISTLCHRPDCTADGVEISAGAAETARANAERNGVQGRFCVIREDAAAFEPAYRYHAFVSNPPYIRSGVIPTLSEEVRSEPLAALDGGADGLSFYRMILQRYKLGREIEADGFLLLEIGYDQAADVTALCTAQGYRTEVFRDYGGNDRAVLAER